jgi:hypothetical protein
MDYPQIYYLYKDYHQNLYDILAFVVQFDENKTCCAFFLGETNTFSIYPNFECFKKESLINGRTLRPSLNC